MRSVLIPAGGVFREALALNPHDAKAVTGWCLHYDPAVKAINDCGAPLFEALYLGRDIIGLDIYVHAALVIDALDFDHRLVRGLQHAVIAPAYRMARVHRTAERSSPEVGGLVQIGGLAVDQYGA
jgi:hypothetical protein